MKEPYITINQLKAFAEIQKAGIDASCEYGTISKRHAIDLKHTIDFLIKIVTDYAISYNDIEEEE